MSYSAYACSEIIATRSPALKPSTSDPTASTRPHASCPSWPGTNGYWNHGRPSHGGMLLAQTPQPSIFTRTSLPRGLGIATSRTSTCPGEVTTAARIVAHLDGCCDGEALWGMA